MIIPSVLLSFLHNYFLHCLPCDILYVWFVKGNTTQVAELAVLDDFKPPIRTTLTRSNHTTNRCITLSVLSISFGHG